MSPRTSQRSFMLRAANTVGAVVSHAHPRLTGLDARSLVAAARRRTGLHDFGGDEFLEPLEILLESYRNEARLNFIGRVVARQSTISLLAGRLRIVEDRRLNPGISRQPVDKPIFIVGLPRTGSTLLHTLLSQDPDNRVPLTWELMDPSPPPERSSFDTDARIARAQRQTRWFGHLAPDFKAIHPVHALQPQECVAILSYAFLSSQFQTMFWIPTYEAWLEQQDLRTAFRWHRRILEHLQWRCQAERWVLKAPMHLFGLDAIVREYPDARIVQTHRDPLTVLASVSSLSAALQRAFSDHIDYPAIGKEVSERWLEGANRSLRFRATRATTDAQILDVYFHDLARDPLAVVRRLYTHFGIELSREAESQMRSFIATNPRHAQGRHVYCLEDYDIDPCEQFDRFSSYREYFGIEPEFVPVATSERRRASGTAAAPAGLAAAGEE